MKSTGVDGTPDLSKRLLKSFLLFCWHFPFSMDISMTGGKVDGLTNDTVGTETRIKVACRLISEDLIENSKSLLCRTMVMCVGHPHLSKLKCSP